MAKNYAKIQQRVNAAITRVADTSQPDGYPATIRRVSNTATQYDPAGGTTTIAYTTVYVVENTIQERDRDGTLTGTVRRSLLVGTGAGIVPNKADKVVVGMTRADVQSAGDTAVDWEEIDDVRPLSPAGVDLMYEIMLAG